jgi:hypothetical protein
MSLCLTATLIPQCWQRELPSGHWLAPMSKKHTDSAWDVDGYFDLEATIEDRRDLREPTQYTAPETDQKWRARNVISFHHRWFALKCPPSYRDVLLCAIDHANPKTGRCNVRQRIMALECNLSRETVNRAMLWWEENTSFLRVENQGQGRSNAYHIQWANLEADWHGIQEIIRSGKFPRKCPGVTTNITGGVTTVITGGVTTDITPRTSKGNHKGEPQHEIGSPSVTHINEKKKEAFKEEPTDSQKISNEEWRKLRGSQK